MKNNATGVGTLLVFFNFSEGIKSDILIIARQNESGFGGGLEYLNAFTGKEAVDIYKRLVNTGGKSGNDQVL